MHTVGLRVSVVEALYGLYRWLHHVYSYLDECVGKACFDCERVFVFVLAGRGPQKQACGPAVGWAFPFSNVHDGSARKCNG